MKPINIKLDKYSWILIAMIIAICVWRIAVLYYWILSPEIELPNSPAIQKSIKYPWISIWSLAIIIPCLMVLIVPILRDAIRVAFVSGIFISFGIATVVGHFYFSGNVAGSMVLFFVAGVHFYKLSRSSHVINNGT